MLSMTSGSVKTLTKQELIFRKIKKYCGDAIDCDDNCVFFSEKYDECIFKVLGLESPVEWECDEDGRE